MGGGERALPWRAAPLASRISLLILVVLGATMASPAAAPADSAGAWLTVPVPMSGESFPGTPAVGALFEGAATAASHFCTASVVHSPKRDLVITAAHCLANSSHPDPIMFVPGFRDGRAPYGVWLTARVVV